MLSKIKTFFALPSPHKFIFIKFLLLVPIIELGVKTIKFNRTLSALKFLTNNKKSTSEDNLKIARRHKNFLYLYHKQFPFLGNCLARSLSLWFLLQRKGVETDLKFGMKKENNELLAHSWIEYKGEPLCSQSELEENYISFNESILTKLIK